MSITPYDYQKKNINEIYVKFKTHNRICYTLPTGGGKTYVFSFLTKFWVDKYKPTRVLILCHRAELIDQTIKSMNQIGVTCEAITSKTSKPKHDSQCYVSMIETANNRLKKNPYFFKDVSLVIADECHILIFDKVFDYFPNAKILGCTATPVVLKRIKFWKCKYCKTKYEVPTDCCDIEADEWSRPFTLSEIYEDIIIGISVNELIEAGKLVRELTFIENYIDADKLKTDESGEFTVASMDKEYSSNDAVFNVLLNYQKLCHGKKTMVFNSSSHVNLILYRKFVESGLNVRMFDSVNVTESGNRKEVIAWFKDPLNRDAILLNVGVFTTGFDVTDVEAIILNLSTASLSLFIQIVGRGVRDTDLIYKEHCIVVDGGGNTDRHQEFSDPTRDWNMLFRNGIGKEKCKKIDAFDIEQCQVCGALYAKTEPCCPECGHVIEPKQKQPKSLSESVLMPIREIPPPNGEKIYRYTLAKCEDTNFAFKIMIGQIKDMFVFYRIEKAQYMASVKRGEAEKKIRKMIQKCYFTLISKPDIKSNNNRTINYLVERTFDKLNKFYLLN